MDLYPAGYDELQRLAMPTPSLGMNEVENASSGLPRLIMISDEQAFGLPAAMV